MAQLHATGLHWKLFRLRCLCTKSRNHSGQTTSPTMNSRLLGEKANLQEKNESTTNKSCSNRICKSLLPECKCQFHSAFSRDILSASTRRAKGFSFAPTFEQIRCNDGHIDTQLWPHQTSWIFLWRALSASSGWGPVEYQPRKNHLLYGYVFGLVGSWSKVVNRTQRVLPMPSTEEPSKKFISWKNLQGRLVIFRYSISPFFLLTAIVESLQNLPPNTGKAAAGRIPDPMTFGRSNSQRECGKRMLLRLRPLASRFYTNKAQRSCARPPAWTQGRPIFLEAFRIKILKST